MKALRHTYNRHQDPKALPRYNANTLRQTCRYNTSLRISGKAGQRFAKELAKNPDEAAAYKALAGRDAKRAFRIKWAAAKRAAAEEALTLHKTQSTTVSDELHGQYLPFKRIWEMEGNDQAGYQARNSQQLINHTFAKQCGKKHRQTGTHTDTLADRQTQLTQAHLSQAPTQQSFGPGFACRS